MLSSIRSFCGSSSSPLALPPLLLLARREVAALDEELEPRVAPVAHPVRLVLEVHDLGLVYERVAEAPLAAATSGISDELCWR